MSLCSLFVPTMAYVQSVEQMANPSAQEVHDQLDSLILSARELALAGELPHERFREALFPVVAWCDERFANLPAWKANHDWRPLMLQKKIFKTSLAGVLFYEQLESLSKDDNDLREIFVLCLSMGFLGRYSQHPNDPDLIKLRLAHYKLVRPSKANSENASDEHLFPEAYRVLSAEGRQNTKKLHRRRFLIVAVLGPIFLIVALAFIFNHDLSLKISSITQMLNL
jgi:type VI secretion system protein ImpK